MARIPQLGAVGEFRSRLGLAQGCLVYAVGGRGEMANLARDEFPVVGGTGTGLSTVYGIPGAALATDGTANGYITYGASADFNVGTGDFAIAVLLRQDAVTNVVPIQINGGVEFVLGSSSTAGALTVRLANGTTQTSPANSLNDNNYHVAIFSRRNGTGTFVVDGVQISSAAMATSITASSGLTIGRRPSAGTNFAIPGLAMLGYWSRALSSDEIATLTADPFVLTRAAAAEWLLKPRGVDYPLTGATGSIATSGNAANLRATRTLSAATGPVALTGNAATLRRALMLAGATGSFSMSGGAASLRADRRMQGATGTFAMSGNPATFPRTYVLRCATGTFSMVGNDAGLSSSALPSSANFYPRERRIRRLAT